MAAWLSLDVEHGKMSLRRNFTRNGLYTCSLSRRVLNVNLATDDTCNANSQRIDDLMVSLLYTCALPSRASICK